MTMTKTVKRVVAGILMVAALAAPAAAAAQNGTTSRVRAFQTDSWTVWVSAGHHEVLVSGDGDTDLDLFVYNSAGRLLDSDDDNTDFCVTSFYMPRAGYITIRIRNLGEVYNEYGLIVR